jgi:hypothetical protein
LLLRRLSGERVAACYAIGDAVVRGNDEYVVSRREQVLRLEELLATAAAQLAQGARRAQPARAPVAPEPADEAFESDAPTVPDALHPEPQRELVPR